MDHFGPKKTGQLVTLKKTGTLGEPFGCAHWELLSLKMKQTLWGNDCGQHWELCHSDSRSNIPPSDLYLVKSKLSKAGPSDRACPTSQVSAKNCRGSLGPQVTARSSLPATHLSGATSEDGF